MTRTEVKNKINQIFDRLSDRSLEAIYDVLKKTEGNQKIDIKSNLDKILAEDAGLLQKLAE